MERFENAALMTMDQKSNLQALDKYLASVIQMVRQGNALTLITIRSFHPLRQKRLHSYVS